MLFGRRHDAHNVDIAPMSCKYSSISQDGCPTRNPMTYTYLSDARSSTNYWSFSSVVIKQALSTPLECWA